jgi:hypothetical protein
VLYATSSGAVIDWYGVASGGTALLSGNNTYTTPSLSASTTYYTQARSTSAGSCTSAARTAVTATVNTVPANPTVTAAARCGTGTVALRASSSGAVIDWYGVASGGTALLSGNNTYTTPSLTATTTYYAQARSTSAGSCTSAARTAVVATVNATPTIARTGGAATQSVSQYVAISTITYTASNATSISRGGSLPAGVSGAASGLVYTISGTPSATGTYGYTVTASHTNGCSTTTAGTLTVNIPPTPPSAASTRTWVIGTQTWSDAIKAKPSGCTETTNFGTTDPPTTAYYWTSGLQSGSGYLYNYKCLNENAASLCPSPWHVPLIADFVTLDIALGGTGENRWGVGAAWIQTNLIERWGGVFSGYANGTVISEKGTAIAYFANELNQYNMVGHLYTNAEWTSVETTGNTVSYRRYGAQIRCVR